MRVASLLEQKSRRPCAYPAGAPLIALAPARTTPFLCTRGLCPCFPSLAERLSSSLLSLSLSLFPPSLLPCRVPLPCFLRAFPAPPFPSSLGPRRGASSPARAHLPSQSSALLSLAFSLVPRRLVRSSSCARLAAAPQLGSPSPVSCDLPARRAPRPSYGAPAPWLAACPSPLFPPSSLLPIQLFSVALPLSFPAAA